jgi:hypothetical protein
VGQVFGPCLDAGKDSETCKNDAVTDQEASLVQAVAKYVNVSGNVTFLRDRLPDGRSVLQHCEAALLWVLHQRRDPKTGLIYGATTMDWGDVQVEGSAVREVRRLGIGSHRSSTTYEQAMLIGAIDAFVEMRRKVSIADTVESHSASGAPVRGVWSDTAAGAAVKGRQRVVAAHGHAATLQPQPLTSELGSEAAEAVPPERETDWSAVRTQLVRSTRTYLWPKGQPFPLAHKYLSDGSPFSSSFNESTVHAHGSMAVAALLGLLSREELLAAYHAMQQDVAEARKQGFDMTIGMTLGPRPYPLARGLMLHPPFDYQNGGDWTWYGARMVQALAAYGYPSEAAEAARPMLERVVKHGGFFEFWDQHGTPRGSDGFRGAAGTLVKAIQLTEAACARAHGIALL